MSYLAPSTSFFQSTKRICQGTICHGPGGGKRQSPHTVSIHILDDDSLLNIFFLYRPFILDEVEDDEISPVGDIEWDCERWWYKLARVCQRWRNLILGSASYLGTCLVCTYRTRVADMLVHSPPLPLVIDFYDAYLEPTVEEVDGILFALKRRDLIRCIRLRMPVPALQGLLMAMDEEYPVLEYLIMGPNMEDNSTALVPPETLQAPHLRHLKLLGFALPIGYRLLTTSVGLVTLTLVGVHLSSYFHPYFLLQWLSCMPQLEKLQIDFYHPVFNSDINRQPIHVPITTNVTVPNLRLFEFWGCFDAYLEAVVHRITAPRLRWFRALFYQLSPFSIPSLLPFLNTTKNLRFDSVEIDFSRYAVSVRAYLREVAEVAQARESYDNALSMSMISWKLNWQVSSVAQIFNSPGQTFAGVEHLTLGHNWPSEEQDEAERNEWHKLLRPFGKVKTLRIGDGIVKEFSHCLRPDGGELPLELLPELQELSYSGSGDADDAFTSFIDYRQNAGHPVTLIRHRERPLNSFTSSTNGN